ncbi:MAG: RDD family protein, partial [Planctomycetota bacterium]
MSIKFKCTCGRELDVPDDTAGKEVFCPGCRKSVPVPPAGELAEPVPTDEREASEFKPGALANILGSDAPAAEKPAPAGNPGKDGPAKPAEPEKPEETDEPDEPEKPAQPAAAEAEAEAIKVAPKVGPASETQDVPPPDGVEIFPNKIKFRCQCGQKVAVRLPPPQSAGKCPRCKRSLSIPTVPGVTDRRPEGARAKPQTAARDLRRCSKCGRRIEDPAAAFCPRCGFPLSDLPLPEVEPEPEPAAEPERAAPPAQDQDLRLKSARYAAQSAAERLRPVARMEVPVPAPMPPPLASGGPAGIGRRLGAFVLDSLATAGVGFGGYMLTAGVDMAVAQAAAALAAGGAFMIVNAVVFAALCGGRSLGMTVTGVRVVGYEGQPAGALLLLVRMLSELILFFGAPL